MSSPSPSPPIRLLWAQLNDNQPFSVKLGTAFLRTTSLVHDLKLLILSYLRANHNPHLSDIVLLKNGKVIPANIPYETLLSHNCYEMPLRVRQVSLSEPFLNPNKSLLHTPCKEEPECRYVDNVADDTCIKVWSMLWNPDHKLQIPIPETIIFKDGQCLGYMDFSMKSKQITRTSRVMDLTMQRTRILRGARPHSTMSPMYVATLKRTDQLSLRLVHEQALPRILRHMLSFSDVDLSDLGAVDATKDPLGFSIAKRGHPPACLI
jgi:hypothetical protein